jgi:O-methyltransferase
MHSTAASFLQDLHDRARAHLARRAMRRFLHGQRVRNHTVLDDEEFLSFYGQLRTERTALLSLREVYNLWRYGRMSLAVPGDFAEVGVFRGGGARVLKAVKDGRTLHLFDTFRGMPQTDPARDTMHKAGDFADASLEAVKRYLGTEGIRYYAGFFPDTTRGHEEALSRFAFVHLDVDIYQSTLDSLRFFYPRLSPGGMIVTHDYSAQSCPGVAAAYDEFFADKAERVIPVWDSQAVVVKQSPVPGDSVTPRAGLPARAGWR